jgi:hypothetical protein
MASSVCSRLSLSSEFEMCEIVIDDDKKKSREMEANHDDREVMNVLKFVLDGECADDDFLPKLLKMNKGKLVKDIFTLISRVVACNVKIDKLERKVEKYKFRYSNVCDFLLSDNYKIICTIACLNSEIELLKSNVSFDSCVGMLAENEKLNLDYFSCVHSSTCSSTLNSDTCIDSNDNYDVFLDINVCNVSSISCTSCNNLKHEIDDLKQVHNDMSAKLVEHNETISKLI